MTHSYIAFIDESGDDGLKKFRTTGQGGGSNWLVLSCVVARAIHDLDFVRWRDDIKETVTLLSPKKDIHFRELTHSQKIAACQKIADLPIRTISVFSNKTLIPAGIYNRKNQLYWYLARHLLERISWFCRDMRASVPEGDGRVRIVFSRRGSMNYNDFRTYLRTLKEQADNGDDVRIHWPVIDIDAVEALDHSKNAGLQIADAIAYSHFSAFEPDEFGNIETRYASILTKNLYRRSNKILSYGIKILPNPEGLTLNNDQSAYLRGLG